MTEMTSKTLNELNLHNIVPPTLHGTYSFKVFQGLIKSNQIYSPTSIKAAIFGDSDAKWMRKVNSQMRKCYEKLGEQKSEEPEEDKEEEATMEVDEQSSE